jgi:small-conductance mechanosensitive channel
MNPDPLRLLILPTPDVLVQSGARIVLTLAVAFALQRALFLLIGRLEKFLIHAGRGVPPAVQRAHTLGHILRSLTTVVIGGGALIHVLELFGWNVSPLLAGAGILGVALGFGAQTLVRDVIAGVFILAENQFSVGDLIEINGKPATVESLTVRCTVLRDFNGYVHFVPNGEMKIVTNRSRDWNLLPVDVVVAPDQNLDRALEICRIVVNELNADPAWQSRWLDPIDVWGIEAVGGQEALIRIVVRAQPGSDAPETSRELRRRIYQALGRAGIRAGVAREILWGGPGAVLLGKHAEAGEAIEPDAGASAPSSGRNAA